jgi:signal transduction histidine kinase
MPEDASGTLLSGARERRMERPVRLVILDDDPATLTLERRVLERAGYVVVPTTTPDEANEAVRKEAPDLLVLDYRIGGVLNGLDVFRALRAAGHNLPAILVTSFSDESKIIEGLRAGIRDVVPKSGDYLDYLPLAVARVVEQVEAERQRFESEALRHLVDRLQQSIASQEAAARDNERLLESERVARAESQRANRLKDEFLATLSHELRTPLNAILGWAQLLRMRPRTADELDQGLQTIERNARVQAQIVEDLLEMSRIISGKLHLDLQRVDLALIVDTAVQSVMPAADAKEIRLRRSIEPQIGVISGDPARLQQILWNLLSNAIKFTPKGGSVDVRLARFESHVEIGVTDSGVGIRPEFLPYLFDRFRQGDASTTREHRGMGLGLSIVKSLVEMHGGTVTAQSDGEGRGASFVVALPLPAMREEPESLAGMRHAPTIEAARTGRVMPHLPGVRVLVVDDEADARELLKRVLAECEADVEVVASAAEALQAIEERRPDVIVSDIGMPQMDGYELIRTVRGWPTERGGQIPAIALTALARAEDRQRALVAGYQAHVAKPVDPSELIALIAKLAGRLTIRASSSS